jgi:hypothetical protein
MPLQSEHERCLARDKVPPDIKTLLHFLMSNVLAAKLAELVSLQPVRIVLLVLAGRIVTLLTDRTGQVNNFSHVVYP